MMPLPPPAGRAFRRVGLERYRAARFCTVQPGEGGSTASPVPTARAAWGQASACPHGRYGGAGRRAASPRRAATSAVPDRRRTGFGRRQRRVGDVRPLAALALRALWAALPGAPSWVGSGGRALRRPRVGGAVGGRPKGAPACAPARRLEGPRRPRVRGLARPRGPPRPACRPTARLSDGWSDRPSVGAEGCCQDRHSRPLLPQPPGGCGGPRQPRPRWPRLPPPQQGHDRGCFFPLPAPTAPSMPSAGSRPPLEETLRLAEYNRR